MSKNIIKNLQYIWEIVSTVKKKRIKHVGMTHYGVKQSNDKES